MSNLFDKISASLRNYAKTDPMNRDLKNRDYIYLVRDSIDHKVTNYAISTTNDNLPELIEALLYEDFKNRESEFAYYQEYLDRFFEDVAEHASKNGKMLL